MEFKQIWDTFVTIPKDELPIEKKGNLGLDYCGPTHFTSPLALSRAYVQLRQGEGLRRWQHDGLASITIGEHVRDVATSDGQQEQ